jgi:hypothetical protein
MSLNKYKSAVSWERDSNTMLVGPTSSGKSSLLKQVLLEGYFLPSQPQRIYILAPPSTVTSTWTDKPNETDPNVKYPLIITDLKKKYKQVEVLAGTDKLKNFLAHSHDTPESSVVIFDDYMDLLDHKDDNRAFTAWFYKITHARHLWTFFVTHNMFTPGILPMRSNTQNFLLFNALQSDRARATQFVQRLLGVVPGRMFLELWEWALAHYEKGWIRLDQKLRGDPNWRTVVSTGGVTLETVWFGAKSGADGQLHVDVTSPSSAPDNPNTVVPTSDKTTTTTTAEDDAGPSRTEPAGGVPADGPVDMQLSDGYQPISGEY